MASFSDQVKVLIDVDSTGATSGLTNFKKSFTEAEGAVAKFKVASGAALDFVKHNMTMFASAGAAAFAAFAVKAIGAASDFEESLAKIGQIFGSASQDIKDFATNASRDIGQSKQDVLDAAGTFGIFGKAAGLAGSDLGKFTIDLTKLASDLASFNNSTPEEAVLAIGAALRGESEPIRRFGVLINDAALKSEAFKMGIYNGTGALTDQQKVLATNELLFRQTKDAQGDFARTSDGLANQSRILSAELENVTITMGERLLPAAVEFLQFANDYLIPVLTGVTDSTSFWGRTFNFVSGFITRDAKKISMAFSGNDGIDESVDRATKAFWDSQEAMNRARYQGLKLTQQMGLMDEGVNDLTESWKDFLGELDDERAWANLEQSITEYNDAVVTAFKKNTPDAWAAADEARRNAAEGIADYIDQVKNIPANIQTEILAIVKSGDFEAAKKIIASIPKQVVVDIVGRVRGVPIPRGQTPSETSGRGTRSTMDIKGISVLPDNAGEAVNALDKDTNGLIDSWDSLLERLDRNEAWDNIGDQIAEYRRDLLDAFKKKTPDAARTAIESSRDVIRAFADIAQQAKLTNDQQIALKALMDKGDFDKAYAELDKMLKGLPTEVIISIKPSDQTQGSGQTPSSTQPNAPALSMEEQISRGVAQRGRIAGVPVLDVFSATASSGTNVIVNVAGSVVTQNDLVEQMRIGLINAQKSGKQLVYSNT